MKECGEGSELHVLARSSATLSLGALVWFYLSMAMSIGGKECSDSSVPRP